MNTSASPSASPSATIVHRDVVQNPTGKPLPKVHQGSARMFESDFIERFSRVHPATPVVVFGPVVVLALYLSVAKFGFSVLGAAAAALVGYVGWMFSEYWLHRRVFHLKVVGPKTKRAYFLIHGVHHDYPWDLSRLVIPPGASIILAAMVFGLFRLVLGPVAMYPYFAGFVAGYVVYDTTHWYIHARVPRTRFGRWLRREHMVHHFKAPNSRYGVSCPWLDHLFRTTGEKDANP